MAAGPFELYTSVVLQADLGATVWGDVNGNGIANAVDLQLVVNRVLGVDIAPHDADLNDDGSVNALDIQLDVNALLGIARPG